MDHLRCRRCTRSHPRRWSRRSRSNEHEPAWCRRIGRPRRTADRLEGQRSRRQFGTHEGHRHICDGHVVGYGDHGRVRGFGRIACGRIDGIHHLARVTGDSGLRGVADLSRQRTEPGRSEAEGRLRPVACVAPVSGNSSVSRICPVACIRSVSGNPAVAREPGIARVTGEPGFGGLRGFGGFGRI